MVEKHFYQVGNSVIYAMGEEMELSSSRVSATVVATTWESEGVPTYTLKIQENGQLIENVSHDGIDMPARWWEM